MFLVLRRLNLDWDICNLYELSNDGLMAGLPFPKGKLTTGIKMLNVHNLWL